MPLHTELLGQRVFSGPFEDPIQKVRVCFLGTDRPGDVVVELVEPLGADSPIRQMLAKGVAGYHVCYEVADLDGALAAVRARRWVVVSEPVPAVAFGGQRIAWFYTPTQELVELLEMKI
jgi:methylmalonyl-CoA/ethylmalonyl-CoA epimerase